MGLTEVFSRFSFRAPIAALGFGVGGGSPSSSPPPPARGGEGSGTSSSSSTNDKTAAAPHPAQQQQPAASLSLAGPAHHGGQQANGPAATAGPRSPVAAPGASSSSSMESSFVLVAYPAPQQQPQGLPPQELSPQQQQQLEQPQQQPAAKPEAAGPCASAPSAVAATAAPQQGDGEEKSESAAAAASSSTTTITTTAPTSPETPAVMVRRIPVLPEWRERLPLVMLQSKPDGTNTPIGIIKELSGALSIEATAGDGAGDGDGGASVIEIRAQEWQQLKEAEALLRLTFRDYDGVSVWWFYTIPTFVSCIISGTTGTEVPELSNPAVGLKCAIAPYDENSTRRAFFLTCPEWDPLNAAYQRIRKGWNYWRYQSLEKQIDRALGVLYGVSIAPIKADGSCLFRAFAKAVLGDEERHPETRAAIVACLRASEELRLFIVSDDEGEDSEAYAERYLEEMSKPGTWGDQVEITAFTRVYGRSVRVFSYNYSENRLLSVGTPIEEAQAPQGPEVWLLHLHGHYSLLASGVAPKDEGWQRLLREFEEEKGEQPVAAAAKAAVGAPGSKAGPATAAAATAVDAGREKEGEKAKEAVVAGREGEQGRPATPMEEAEKAEVASVAAAMEVEREEGKQEEGGRVLMRVCSSTTVTHTTAAAAVGVEGSVVMVECTSSSTSQRVITATAAMAEGE